jgi:hypothetical protein
VRKNFIEIPVAVTYRTKWTLNWSLSSRYPHQNEFLRVVRKLQRAA